MTSCYEQFEVIVVPFLFTDKAATKRRPALVLSRKDIFNTPASHSVMAMITTATHSSWPLDVSITELKATGLTSPSIVRMKLFTLDHTQVIRTIGKLSDSDAAAVELTLKQLLRLSCD